MSRVLSSGKAGHLKSFVLIPHLPFSQLWLATGNTIQQVQLIKPWTSRRDCQMLLWTKPYLMDQRVGKGTKRTIAFPGALKDSTDFWRSKFPKRVWINLLHASKQSQWECLIPTSLAFCHFPCSQQNQQTVTMKYRGCRNTWNTEDAERNTSCNMGSSNDEKVMQKGSDLFQASCYLNYIFRILIVFGIFKTMWYLVPILFLFVQTKITLKQMHKSWVSNLGTHTEIGWEI